MPQSKEHNMITQGFPTKSYDVRNSNKNKQQQNDNVPPIGKSGFVSHTKHTVEATNMNLFHS